MYFAVAPGVHTFAGLKYCWGAREELFRLFPGHGKAMTMLRLLSVNVGLPRVIGTVRGEAVLSGIAKKPVRSDQVMVRATNIDGDRQADLAVHGGHDKAVYAYPAAHWPWWDAEKKLACVPGTFGENLTLEGIDETQVRIGDRFAWGEAVLEVSQPRAPCFKLALHTARADVPAAMTMSGRCGWYLRVVRDGAAPAHGELETVLKSDGPTVREAFACVFAQGADREALLRIHAASALAPAWRNMVARKLVGEAG